jgi:hypothetical protein
MPVRRYSLRALRGVLLAGVLCAAVGAAAGAPPVAADGDAAYDRADPPRVRAEIRRILDDPRFALRESLWERAMGVIHEWLASLLRWGARGAWWARALMWVLLGWCVLAVLAVLAHLVWTIVMVVRGRRGPAAGAVRRAGVPTVRELTYDQLCRRMAELARAGAFREAVGVMMQALLRRLDDVEIIRLARGKTNGDYVREYPRARGGREAFRRFALAVDHAVYAGGACDLRAFQAVRRRFDEVRQDVGEK